MFGASRQPIYGGSLPPPYVASSGANVFVSSSNPLNWVADLKNSVRWTQFGDFLTTRPWLKTSLIGSRPESLEYGASTFVVLNASSGAVFFGKYIKAGFGWRDISKAGITTNPLNVNFGNGIFVASGTNNSRFIRVVTSTNGSTWTQLTILDADPQEGITCWTTFSNGMFVLSYEGGNSAVSADRIFTSTNGTIWTQRATPTVSGVPFWRCKIVGSTLFLHRVPSFTPEFISTDGGLNWTPVTSTSTEKAIPIIFSNGVYIGKSINNDILVSSDGYNWNTVIPNTNQLALINGYTNSAITIVGSNFRAVSSNTGNIYESSDGVNWTAIDQAIPFAGGAGNLGIRYGNL